MKKITLFTSLLLALCSFYFVSCGAETGSYELSYSIWTPENPSNSALEYYESENFPTNEDGNYYCYVYYITSTPSKHKKFINQTIFHPEKQGVGDLYGDLTKLSVYQKALNDGFYHEFTLSNDGKKHLCMNFKNNPSFLLLDNQTGYSVSCGAGYAPKDLWDNDRNAFWDYTIRDQEDHRWIWMESKEYGAFEVIKTNHTTDLVKLEFWVDKNDDGFVPGTEYAGAWAKGSVTEYPDYGYIYAKLTLASNGYVDTTWEVYDYANRKVDRSMNFESNAFAAPGSTVYDAPGRTE